MTEPRDGFADTPAPPYVAVIFTSRRTADHGEDYAATAESMNALAGQQPGYLGLESARDSHRLGITVSYWASEQHAQSWKRVAEHLVAQQHGREHWYEHYSVRIATVTRAYERPSS